MRTHAIRPLTLSDTPAIWNVLVDDGGFSERVEGRTPVTGDVENLFTTRPPSVESEHKHTLGLYEDDELIGIADVIEDWPEADINYIGLLQIKASHHGRGLARHFHEQLRTQFAATRWRLSVVDSNTQAAGFWQALGYEPTGEQKPWQNDNGQIHTATIFEASSDALAHRSPSKIASPLHHLTTCC